MGSLPPPYLPEAMLALTASCQGCGQKIKPNLWEKRQDPFIPIKANDDEKGRWHQTGVYIECTCGSRALLDIEYVKPRYKAFFFGDEAYREIGKNLIIVYSCMGATGNFVEECSAKLRDLKGALVPTLSPDAWKVHVTQLRAADKRLLNRHFSGITRGKYIDFMRGCSELIGQLSRVGYCVCGIATYGIGNHEKKERKKVRGAIERDVFLGVIGDIIFNTTRQGILPSFTFDAQSVRGIERGVEPWAENSYQFSRHFLGHLLLTHSNEVEVPKFVRPGSHAFLELADVHAFYAARYLSNIIQNKTEDEVDMASFGRFQYLRIWGNKIDRFQNLSNDLVFYR